VDAIRLREQVGAVNWFHSIDLGQGIVTPGLDDSPKKLQQIHLPGSLQGRTVLDIGAWDGFFSFEAERRGADRVVAVDSYSWSGPGWGTQDGFHLARRVLDSRVEDLEMEVLDLSPERVGTFDVVLFLGVLYHMKRPDDALECVARLTKDLLILETHVDLLNLRTPAVALYPGRELDDDPTNWCGPNHAALEWMLRDVGFTDLERVFESPRWWRAGRAAKLAGRGRSPFLRAYRQGRVVYHARKVGRTGDGPAGWSIGGVRRRPVR
jgi:tRNA (mo5U34)-methyltransferase